MTGFAGSIARGLRALTRFSGRDAPSQFWPYALCVVGCWMLLVAAVMSSFMAMIFSRMQQFAADHPEQVTVTTGPGSYSMQISGDSPVLMPDMTPMVAGLGVAVALAVFFLAAAVTRRLHDRGRSGYWGLAPLPFLVIGLSAFPALMSASNGDTGAGAPTGMLLALFFNNVLYLAALALLFVLLLKGSDRAANRYGEPSV